MRIDPHRYDGDYYERGPVLGISGYMNFSWMPELTLRMAHKFIQLLPIAQNEKVLDVGCAKGFLVKALRILDIDACGVDVSEYAIKHLDGDVRDHCWQISGCDDPGFFRSTYDWLIAKDVMEHMTEEELSTLLRRARPVVRKMFVAVPLASDDECGKYIIAEYDRDVTHVIRKSLNWWTNLFESHGWRADLVAHQFPGCKENWTSRWQDGNGFFVVSRNGEP